MAIDYEIVRKERIVDGKKYNIGGKDIVLYPIARLSQELAIHGIQRDVQTLRKWEAKGVTPKCPFRVKGKRMYTAEHIQVYVDTIKECGLHVRGGLTRNDFSEKMWERLKEVNKKYGV